MGLALQYLINGILVGMTYAVFSTGYALVFSTTRFLHVAAGGVFAVSGVMTWLMYVKAGLPLAIAIIFGIALSVGLSCIIEIFIYQPLRNRKTTVLLTMITSLGVMTVIQNGLALAFDSSIKFMPTSFGTMITPYFAVTHWKLITFVVSAVLLGIMHWFLEHTRTGEEIRAVGSNLFMSQAIGISLRKIYIAAMVICAILVGWAGASEAVSSGANPNGGMSIMMVGMVVKLLGGVRNTKNIIIISFIYGLCENMALLIVPSQWTSSLTFAVFVILMLVIANPQRLAAE